MTLKAKKVKGSSSSHPSPSKHGHLPKNQSEASSPMSVAQPGKVRSSKVAQHIPPPPDLSPACSSKVQSSKVTARPSKKPDQGRPKASRQEVKEIENAMRKGYEKPTSLEEEGAEGIKRIAGMHKV